MTDGSKLRDLLNLGLKQALIQLGSDSLDSTVTGFIPTGWTLVDEAIGGGLPLGRTVEVYGAESTGKSTLALQAIASCQQLGGYAVVFDVEAAFYKDMAPIFGIDLDKVFLISNVVTLEKLFGIFISILGMLREKHPDSPVLIVWDTLAATTTDMELESVDKGDVDRMSPQYRAQVIKRGMRVISRELTETKACLLIINHVYEKANKQTGFVTYESPGGSGPRFAATVRIYLKIAGTLKESDDGDVVGTKVIARLTKNKMGFPRREIGSRFYFGQGFSDHWSLFDYAVEWGIIGASSSWKTFEFGGGKPIKFYAKDFPKKLIENEGMLEALKEKVVEHYRSRGSGV